MPVRFAPTLPFLTLMKDEVCIMPYYSPRWDNRWQVQYRAAMFGQNLVSAGQLIAQAESAIAFRENELAQGPPGPLVDAEREAMEDALYALKALRTAPHMSSAA